MSSPLDTVFTKLANRQSAVIQALGDSTTRGFYGNTVVGNGYPGQLGINLGKQFDVTVHYRRYNQGPSQTGTELYDLNVQTLWSSSTDGTVLEIYNGGVDGAALDGGPYPAQTYYDNGTLVTADPDAFFFGYGFNDQAYYSAATYAAYARTFINKLITDHPGVPIVVTSQNVCKGFVGFGVTPAPGTDGAKRKPYWDALFGLFLNQGIFLDPVLQQSSSTPQVWCLDTCGQADWTWTTNYSSWGVHPKAAQYVAIGNWIFTELIAGSSGGGSGSSTNRIVTTLGAPDVSRTVNAAPTLPANWNPSTTFTADDENAVISAVNLIGGVVLQLGGTPPSALTDTYSAGSIWTAANAEAVVDNINALTIAATQLGAPDLVPVAPVGGQWTSHDENTVEAAINALNSAVTTLAGGI